MTTFSAIANSEIAVGAPVTNSLMTKNRDNPLAIQENDPSAPDVQYAVSAGSASSATTAGSASSATTAGSISGQGALATRNTVANGHIDNSAVNSVKINKAVGTTSIFSVAANSTLLIPAGFYFFYTNTFIDLLVSAVPVGNFTNGKFVWSDGASFSLYENDGVGTQNISYKKLA